MAFAKKCDICGKLYEEYNVAKNEKKTNGMRFLNLDYQRKYYYAHDPIDCCPECMGSIRNHIVLLKNGGCSDKKAGD